MKIVWKQGRWLPAFIKGGAMGIVDGAPVYAAGCTFPWRETEEAWWWDAERSDWFPVEPRLPLGRCYTQGATAGDGLVIVGGRKSTSEGRVSLRDAWWLRRHGGAFAWTALPETNEPRAIASVGVLGTRVLAFGGGEWERSQGGAFATRHLTRYEILDLDAPRHGWRDMGALPFASLVGSAVASAGESTYVFGGYECWTEEGKRQIRYSNAAWRYDFGANRWHRLADLPFAASGWCAVTFSDVVVLMGGGLRVPLLGGEIGYHTFQIVERGSARERLVGGYSDLVFLYEMGADRYRLLPERMPLGLNDLRATITGNQIYAAGGETADAALSNCSSAFMIGAIE